MIWRHQNILVKFPDLKTTLGYIFLGKTTKVLITRNQPQYFLNVLSIKPVTVDYSVYSSGVARNLDWGVQLDNFGLNTLLMLKLCR